LESRCDKWRRRAGATSVQEAATDDAQRIAKGRAAFRASRLSAGLGAETENGMKAGEMKQRRDEVITRMLEIEAELKEMKRIWLTEGKEGAPGVRATLEAESAALNCEKNKLNLAIHAGKKAEQAYKQATFTATLVRLLQERDMAELVREAERISMDMMISA